MKLKINQLIKVIKPMLEELGFTYFPHKWTWPGGVFCKKESNNLFITIGMNIHRFYDFNFTLDMYYSNITGIGTTYGDIPFESSVRPCKLLSKEERLALLLPEEPIDLWWDSLEPNTLKTIQKAIIISEQKLLSNKFLLKRIENSVDTKELFNIGLDIIQLVENNKLNEGIKYLFAPAKETNGIPVIWFQAAEIICKKYYGKINKNCVYCSAGDAYRIYTLNKMQDGE